MLQSWSIGTSVCRLLLTEGKRTYMARLVLQVRLYDTICSSYRISMSHFQKKRNYPVMKPLRKKKTTMGIRTKQTIKLFYITHLPPPPPANIPTKKNPPSTLPHVHSPLPPHPLHTIHHHLRRTKNPTRILHSPLVQNPLLTPRPHPIPITIHDILLLIHIHSACTSTSAC